MHRRIKVSENQKKIFAIDDTDNVTYYVNGFAQSLEELLEYDPVTQNIDIDAISPELQLMGYDEPIESSKTIESVEKEDDRTVMLSISDLEKVRKILTTIPQFRDLALESGSNVDSLEFLAKAVGQVDFLSLPYFEMDMSIFDMLPKNNPEYRNFIFSNVLNLVNQIAITRKFPPRRLVREVFLDFDDTQIDQIYEFIKRIIGLLNVWGGIQIHLFEQTVRDWMYVVYERGSSMDQQQIYEYLKTKYTCKPDFELMQLAALIKNSTSFNTTIEDFTDEFIDYMHCYTPDESQFLTGHEIMEIWTCDFLRTRVRQAAQKWKDRMEQAKIVDYENELDSFFGVRGRLNVRANQNVIPHEVYGEKSVNETVIKLKLYFPEGHRTLVEARIDRLTEGPDGLSIYDWKTKRRELEDMSDFEKLQIVLQCIAVKQATKTADGTVMSPMVNKDYKFFLTSTSTHWINTTGLPAFYHIPEQSQELYEYVDLNIPQEEVNRLLIQFSSIVHFLICNKKAIARIRRHLKNIDSYISAPRLIKPVEFIDLKELERLRMQIEQ